MFQLPVCVPVVYRWEGHGTTVHSLRGWRRKRDLLLVVVMSAAQCPALISYHRPPPVIMFCTRAVTCCQLGGQDAGRRARVGVGVAGVVHGVGIMHLVGTVTPGKDGKIECEI